MAVGAGIRILTAFGRGSATTARVAGRGTMGAARASGRVLTRARKALVGGGILGGGALGIKGLIGGALAGLANQNKKEDHAFRTPEIGEALENQDNNIESIKASDLFSEIKIDPVNIIPELGPEEGEYAIHLNLIIERVAKLESQVATQNGLINKLFGATHKLHEHERRESLDRKRKASEDNIEKKNRSRLFTGAKEFVEAKAGGVQKAIKAALGAASLIAAGVISEAMADVEQGIELPNVESLDIGSMTLPELTEEIGYGIVNYSAAAAGATVGAGLTPETKKGRSRSRSRSRSTTPNVETPSPSSTASAAGGVSQANNKAGFFKRQLDKMMRHADSFKSRIRSITGTVSNWFSKLKGFGRLVTRFVTRLGVAIVAVIELFRFVRNQIEFFATGEITEEEFHDLNKEQMNRVIGRIGLPVIFGVLGGSLGSVVPVLGNISGFAIGVIAGMFAETAYTTLGGDRIMEAVYDSLFIGEDAPMKAIMNSVGSIITTTYNAAQTAKNVAGTIWNYSPANFAIQAGKRTVSTVGGWFGDDTEESEIPIITHEEAIRELDAEWANETQQGEWHAKLVRARSMQNSSSKEFRERGRRVERELLAEISRTNNREPGIETRENVPHIEVQVTRSATDGLRENTGVMAYNPDTGVFERVSNTIVNNTSVNNQNSNTTVNNTNIEQASPAANISSITNVNRTKWWQPEWATPEQKEHWNEIYRTAEHAKTMGPQGRTIAENHIQDIDNKIQVAYQERFGETYPEVSVVPSNSTNVVNNITPNIQTTETKPQPIIIPVMQPPQRRVVDDRMSAGMSAVTAAESASPTQSTADRFIEAGYQT